MARITRTIRYQLSIALFAAITSVGCVSTEALYAEYDAADCNLVAVRDTTGKVSLLEQNSHTHFPWEPAVYFEFDSSELKATEKARLDKSMQVLKQYPSLVLGLQGFTDLRGSKSYNETLAGKRVEQVQQYLVVNGIDLARIKLQPIGEVLPQISTNDTEARAVNRRVELMLLEADGRPMLLEYAMTGGDENPKQVDTNLAQTEAAAE